MAVAGRAALLALLALVAGAVLAACGGATGTVAQQVQSWATSTGWSATVSQLRGDLSRLSVIDSDSPAARRTVCDVLTTDALDANQQLPTPDNTFTSLLSHAYEDAATAGRACFSGGARLDEAAPLAQSSARSLVQAEARYDSLTSELPSS